MLDIPLKQKNNEESAPLLLEDFFFHVPESLVAQKPTCHRDRSRMLIRHSDGRIMESRFNNLSHLIPRDSLLIVNDSRVFCSRIYGFLPSGAKVEVFLLESPYNSLGGLASVKAMAKPLKKLVPGGLVRFTNGVSARVKTIDRTRGCGTVILSFNLPASELLSYLDEQGLVPLPPYINRPCQGKATRSEDKERYQTVFAESIGSVAAPTAGLHFTSDLIDSLIGKGVTIVPVTLHVGGGTFFPVKVQQVEQHSMHEERFFVPARTLSALEVAKKNRQRVIAVGTTTLRCIESLIERSRLDGVATNTLTDTWLSSELFIYPKTRADVFKPTYINGLITNFHQPSSTLFMLVCALIGYQQAKEFYQTAIDSHYRFYSNGDSSLLWL